MTADSGDSLPTGEYYNYYKTTDTTDNITDNDSAKTAGSNKLNLIRESASYDLKPVQPNSGMEKIVEDNSNSVSDSRVNITYTMGAYDGYRIFNGTVKNTYETENADSDSLPNKRTRVAFFDLLPYKVHYDGSTTPTVARITNVSNALPGKHGSSSWNTSNVTLAETTITRDYNGTGRELVTFILEYAGDPSVYANGNWFAGYGVSFGAYVTWSDYETAKDEKNIAAYINMEETNGNLADAADRQLLGAEYTDDAAATIGTKDAEYAAFGSDIDGKCGSGTDDTHASALYAQASGLDPIAISAKSGIEKTVRADNDVTGAFKKSATVAYNGTYTYQIAITNSDQADDTGSLQNIIAFDKLEDGVNQRFDDEKKDSESVFHSLYPDTSSSNYEDEFKSAKAKANDSSWQGTIQKINLSAVDYQTGDGVAVYYNTGDVEVPTLSTSERGTYHFGEPDSNGYCNRLGFVEDSTNSGTYKLVVQKVTVTYEEIDGTKIAKETPATGTEGIVQTISSGWKRIPITTTGATVSFTNSTGSTDSTNPYVVSLNKDEKIQAIAVDFGAYQLANMAHLVFDVQMQAPTGSAISSDKVYAYNNPAYYATMTSTDTVSSNEGSASRVGIGEQNTLTVAKQLTGNTLKQIDNYPALKKAQFTYTVTDNEGEAFADQRYYLWEDYGTTAPTGYGYTRYDPAQETSDTNKITGTSYIEVLQDTVENGVKTAKTHYYTIKDYGTAHTTDAKGQFKLTVNQAATFDVVHADRLTVTEETSDSWSLANEKENTTGQVANTRTKTADDTSTGTAEDTQHPEYIFKNVYNSVVYLQKKISGKPTDVDISDQAFTFQVTVPDDTTGTAVTPTVTYRILKSADLRDANVVKDEDGNKVEGTLTFGDTVDATTATVTAGSTTSAGTSASGTPAADTAAITFNCAYTAALIFPDLLGEEVTFDEILSDLDENWRRKSEDAQPQKLTTDDVTVTFENIYLKKYLDIAKEITHEDAATTRTKDVDGETGVKFSFEVLNSAGERVTNFTEVKLLNSGGYSVYTEATDSDEGTPITSTYDSENGTWKNVSDDELSVSKDGVITANCAGRIIRVEYLDAEKTYTVREVTKNDASGELINANYEAVNGGTETVTMPLLPTGKSVEITNDYLMRGLTVTKRVAANEVDDDPEFTLYLYKLQNGTSEPVKGATYTLSGGASSSATTETDNKKTTGDSSTDSSAEDGSFTLKNGQTATFDELDQAGTKYQICEKVEKIDGEYKYVPLNLTWDETSSDKTTLNEDATVTLGSDGNNNIGFEVINGDKNYMVLSKDYSYIGNTDLSETVKKEVTDKEKNVPVTFCMTITNGTSIARDSVWVKQEDGTYRAYTNNDSENDKLTLEACLKATVTLPGAKYTYESDGAHADGSYGTMTDSETGAETLNYYLGLKDATSNTIYFQTTAGQNVIINTTALKSLFGVTDENLEYTISETVPSDLQKFTEYDSMADTWYGFTVSKAQDITGKSGENQVVTVTNKVDSVVSYRSLYKYKYGGNLSGTVTFLVEKKTGGKYVKQSGVRYMAVDENGNPITEILTTDANGYAKIDASGRQKFMLLLDIGKTEAGTAATITINPNGTDKDYRVTEVADMTDEGCGYLVGYGTSSSFLDTTGTSSTTSEETTGATNSTDNTTSEETTDDPTKVLSKMNYDTGEVFPTEADGADVFINAVGTDTVNIRKEMADGTKAGVFTFRICKVMGSDEIPGADISYSVYTIDGDTPVINADGTAMTGVTGADGIFHLNPGQYAKIEFPKYATWKVYEQATTGYNLIGIEADGDFGKLDESNVADGNMNSDSDKDGLYDGELPKEVAATENGKTKTSASGETVLDNDESYGKWANEQPVDAVYQCQYPVILAQNGNGWSFYLTNKTQDAYLSAIKTAASSDDASYSKAKNAKPLEIKNATETSGTTVMNGTATVFDIAGITALAGNNASGNTTLQIPDTLTTTVSYSLLTKESQQNYDKVNGKPLSSTENSTLVSVKVPVVAVVDSAFSGNTDITSLTLGKKLEYIGKSSFKNLSNLTYIGFPDGNHIMKVDEEAFSTIANKNVITDDIIINLQNCNYIGEKAFYYFCSDCTIRKDVGIKINNTKTGEVIGKNAFDNAFVSGTVEGVVNFNVNVPNGTIGGCAFADMLRDTNMNGGLNVSLHADTVETEAFRSTFGGCVEGDGRMNKNNVINGGTVLIDCKNIKQCGFMYGLRSTEARFDSLTLYLHNGYLTCTGENANATFYGEFTNCAWDTVNIIIVKEKGSKYVFSHVLQDYGYKEEYGKYGKICAKTANVVLYDSDAQASGSFNKIKPNYEKNGITNLTIYADTDSNTLGLGEATYTIDNEAELKKLLLEKFGINVSDNASSASDSIPVVEQYALVDRRRLSDEDSDAEGGDLV